ncbi:MAG: hypothetical protein Q9159_002143 [Coniocarpon cinnabarinum]
MSGHQGAKAHHRASSSRVVPAIPFALEARSRRSVDKPKPLQDAEPASKTGPSSDPRPCHDESSSAIEGSYDAHIAKTSAVNNTNAREAVPGDRSSSELRLPQHVRSNNVQPTEQSFRSISGPSQTSEREAVTGMQQAPNEEESAHVGSSGKSPGPTLPSMRSTAPPHPDAPPFIPNGTANFPPAPYVEPLFAPEVNEWQNDSQRPQATSAHASRGSLEIPPAELSMVPEQERSLHHRFSREYPSASFLGTVAAGPGNHVETIDSSYRTIDGAQRGSTDPDGRLASAGIDLNPSPEPAGEVASLSQSLVGLPDPKMALMTAAYLCGQFGAEEFADFQASAGRKQLPVLIRDRFLTYERALIKAVGRLYTGMLPDPQYVVSDLGLKTSREYMRFALSFAASGHFLEIDEVIGQGVNLVHHFLALDTLELALAFAIDGGVGPSWLPQDGPSEASDSSLSSSEESRPEKMSPRVFATYGVYSDAILRDIFSCLIGYVRSQFTFDTKAPQFQECPRLPPALERHRTRSSSRLTLIRFGEMQAEDEGSFDSTRLALSKHGMLCDKMGSKFVAELMQSVIKERETRRRSALERSVSQQPASTNDDQLWANLRFAEGVEGRTTTLMDDDCRIWVAVRLCVSNLIPTPMTCRDPRLSRGWEAKVSEAQFSRRVWTDGAAGETLA